MTQHRPLTVAALAMAALAMAACGRGESAPAASGAPPTTKTAVVLKTSANPYWQNVSDGAKAAGTASGAEVTVQAAQNESDIAGQTSLLGNLAGGGYQCFAVAPITGTNLVQPLAQISQSKATIVNIDSAIDADAAKTAGITVSTFISSNNTQAGDLAGKEMVKLLDGKGKVAILGGISGDANSNARTTGFRQAAESGGLTVVQTVAADWDREKALNATGDILRANPDLGGIYAANDTMALGAVKAAQNASNTQVKIFGTDGDTAALDSIEAKGLTGTVSQYPYVMGEMGVEACQAAGRGKQLPAKVDAPLALITADTVAKAKTSYPKPVDPYTDPFADLLKG